MANEKNIPYKIYLEENEMPNYWYNVRADMKNKPAPLLNPGTHQPMTAEELGAVFCDELVKQELDNETREYPIPAEILDFYKMYRPSPLVRAYCLEKKLPLDSLSMILLYSTNEHWGDKQVEAREKAMIRVLKNSFDVVNNRNIILEFDS